MALFTKEAAHTNGSTFVKPKPSKMDSDVIHVNIDKLLSNPYQPRKEFDEAGLKELADSIKEHGIMQPLTIAEHPERDGYFYIVAGERRSKAAQLAGLSKVPAILRRVDCQQEMAELALIENIQRSDLNPIEEARAFRTLIDSFKLSHEKLSERTGKPRSSITNSLRLLDLPEPVINAVLNDWPATSARALLPLENRPDECVKVMRLAVNEGWPREKISDVVDTYFLPSIIGVNDGSELQVIREQLDEKGVKSQAKPKPKTLKESTKTEIDRMPKDELIALILDADLDAMKLPELRKLALIIKQAK